MKTYYGEDVSDVINGNLDLADHEAPLPPGTIVRGWLDIEEYDIPLPSMTVDGDIFAGEYFKTHTWPLGMKLGGELLGYDPR